MAFPQPSFQQCLASISAVLSIVSNAYPILGLLEPVTVTLEYGQVRKKLGPSFRGLGEMNLFLMTLWDARIICHLFQAVRR